MSTPTDAVKAAADRAQARSEGTDPGPSQITDTPIVDATPAEDDPAGVVDVVVPGAGGRPTDYRPEYSDIARTLCVRGATIAELAEEFGVVRSTVYLWMSKYPEFSDAVKIGKEYADQRVGFSLYERAVGYTYDAVKITQHQGRVMVTRYKEHVPPDVGAIKHWQLNRQPEQWGRGSGDPPPPPPATDDKPLMDVARRLTYVLNTLVQQQAQAKRTAEDAEYGPASD